MPVETQTLPPQTPFWSFENIFNSYIMPIFWVIIAIIIISVVILLIYKKIKKGKGKELLFKDFNVGNYKVILYRKVGNRYVEIERKTIQINKQEGFKYNNKDFCVFKIDDIAFADSNHNYYAFDYDTGAQLTFNEKNMPESISIDDVDIYVNRGIIKQLIDSLETKTDKAKFLFIIVGAVLGLGIGLIIGMQLNFIGVLL